MSLSKYPRKEDARAAVGDKIRLLKWAVSMSGFAETLPEGSTGTVKMVDSHGSLLVDWDDSVSTLSVLVDDTYEVIS